MRALLVNPQGEKSFWSYDGVLELTGKKALEPPMGLLTVAALLPQEWSYRLLDLRCRKISEQDWQWCDLVLVSGMFVQLQGILDTIKEAKANGKRVLVGGPWVFHDPDTAFAAGADIVVKGELEHVVDHVVAAVDSGRSGVLIEAEGFADLHESPMPRFELANRKDYEEIAIQTSRGCPFDCEFCDVTLMYGRRARTKRPEQVEAELDRVYQLGWRQHLTILDDNFICSPPRTKKILRAMISWQEQHGYPYMFTTQVSVNLASDDELIDLMVRAGFRQVFIGIETTDLECLQRMNKHQNTKLDLAESCEKLNRAGLLVVAGCIIGIDGEEDDADQRLIEFANRAAIPQLHVTLMQALPGTAMWKRLEREQRLLYDLAREPSINNSTLPNFVTTRPLEQVVDEYLRTNTEMYDKRAFTLRAYEHVRRMPAFPYKRRFKFLTFSEMRAVGKVLFRQGVAYSSRFVFWKCLFKGLWHFPKRLDWFLTTCCIGEHLFKYTDGLVADLNEKLRLTEERRHQLPARVSPGND